MFKVSQTCEKIAIIFALLLISESVLSQPRKKRATSRARTKKTARRAPSSSFAPSYTFFFASRSIVQNLRGEEAKINLPGSNVTLSEDVLRDTKVKGTFGLDLQVYYSLPGSPYLLGGFSTELYTEAKYKDANSFNGNEGKISPMFTYLNVAGKLNTGFENYSLFLPDSFIPYLGVGAGSLSYTENPTSNDYYNNTIPEHLNSKGLSLAFRLGIMAKFHRFVLSIDHRIVRGKFEGTVRPLGSYVGTFNATPVEGKLRLNSTSVKLGFVF